MIIACADCGTIQRLPVMHPGSRLRCRLCAKVLERTAGRSLDAALALALATFLLWFPANFSTLLTLHVLGIERSSRLISGAFSLWQEGWLLLAIIVALQGVILPFFRFGLLTASLGAIRLGVQGRWTAVAFRWSGLLDDWSMPDVFLFGAAIGYSRVAVFIPVQIGVGGWSLIGAAFLTLVTRASLDRVSVWRRIHRPDSPEAGPRIACTGCDLVLPAHFAGRRCPRCLARLWRRKPFAIMQATALVIAAYPLYLVANWYPMSLQDQFGKISEQTIAYGVMTLLQAGFWPLAAIIFVASIFIPLAKLLGMSWLLWSAHHGSTSRLVFKTRLYRFIEGVGRWSNIDIFTIAIFLPIMQIGGLVSVSAGRGAPAFLAVIGTNDAGRAVVRPAAPLGSCGAGSMSGETRVVERAPDSGPTRPRVIADPVLALEQRSRWPGWIWAVPVAVIAIVAYLGFRQLTTTGPLIDVVFEGGGIGAGTPVHYRDMQVGQVESAAFEKDLHHVRAHIRMDATMEGHLGPGTAFWIAGPRLSDLASIKSIISGPTIGVLPRPGAVQHDYAALAEPPLMEGIVPGRGFVLLGKQLGNVSRGSAIYFRDLNVGTVQGAKLLPDETFQITIFVAAPYDKLVHDDSQFWDAGGVQFSLAGAGPHLSIPPVGSLIGGAVAFDTPATPSQRGEAASGHTFTLYGSQNEATFAPPANALVYRVVFGTDAGGLAEGAPVMLAGKQVGTVQTSTLHYDGQAGVLRQPVTFVIDPTRLGFGTGNDRNAMDGIMRHLIAQGLRAQPGSAVPLLGPADVELVFVHDAPAATLAGDPPEVPVAPGGAGMQGIMIALNTIANKIDALPLDQIAGDIHIATARLAALSQSPALTDSLDALNCSVTNLERSSVSVREELPSILAELRATARQADSTAAEARQVVASVNGQGPLGLNSSSLSQTLYELTQAARAMRELADYIDRNPSALVRGRQ